MTLYQIIDTLKKIALTQPNIRTSTDGDVFDAMNSNPSIKYGVFHVTQTTHTEDEQFDNYGFNLFVIDRLEDDDSNRVSAQSTAKQQLSNIINTFCETFDAERNEIVYQPFTQRFKDNTCGVWASVTMQVVKDYSCAESYGDGAWYPDIVVINNEDITITKNGVYTPSEGYTGFNKVEVAVPIPVVKEIDSIVLKAGDSGVYIPEEPYTAVEELEYRVLPNQNKSVDYFANGEYTVTADEEYSGLGEVDIVVAIPLQDSKTVNVNNVGTVTITPDEGYTAMQEVNLNVNLEQTKKLPNGITLSNSTWTTFDMEPYDWSLVYDWGKMFENCENLTEIKNFPDNVHALSCYMMFKDCHKLTAVPKFDTSGAVSMKEMFSSCSVLNEIPEMDTSNVLDMSNMFSVCQNLTTIPQLDTHNVTNMEKMFSYCGSLITIPEMDTSNVLNMHRMFYDCTNLTSIPPLDTSNVTDMSYMFETCTNLTSIPPLDTSNVTDMERMFYQCDNLTTIPQLDTSNVTDMFQMFGICSKLTTVRMVGNPSKLTNVNNMFFAITTAGTFYYPAEYAENYQKIINVLPSTWTAVGE